MKETTWSLLLCLSIAASATAQAGPHRDSGDLPPPSAEDRVEHLSQELDLDQNQAARLLEIFFEADKQRKAMREQREEQIRQDICALRSDVTGQIRSVLTAQQSVEFDGLLARRAALRQNFHDRHRKHPWSATECDETGA